MKTVEIVDYYERKTPLYEVMLATEFEKKQRGEEYKVFYRSKEIPFVEWEPPMDSNWFALKKPMSLQEAVSKFGKFDK